ncbi:hypothetical protein E4T38_01971 [Aureobasidium subglaciale]|nr:hypothetical protein E4T38_01971 [Aureobasidium subglaciale]KAI5266059.1 hypothetical protein E4T46_01748 [Aureobasidium subglaciale]
MATGFRSLALEIRNMIYEYALEEDHDIFVHGVPALLKITREVYSYRKIVTTLCIINNHPRPIYRQPFPTEILSTRGFNMITKFNQTEDKKSLIVKFKPLVLSCSKDVNGLLDATSSAEHEHNRAVFDYFQNRMTLARARALAYALGVAAKPVETMVDEHCECATQVNPDEKGQDVKDVTAAKL